MCERRLSTILVCCLTLSAIKPPSLVLLFMLLEVRCLIDVQWFAPFSHERREYIDFEEGGGGNNHSYSSNKQIVHGAGVNIFCNP